MSQRSRITTNASLSHRSARCALASLAFVGFAACKSPARGVTSPPLPGTAVAPFVGLMAAPNFGEPLANLTATELALFNDGKVEFETAEDVEEGLGPVFNEAS